MRQLNNQDDTRAERGKTHWILLHQSGVLTGSGRFDCLRSEHRVSTAYGLSEPTSHGNMHFANVGAGQVRLTVLAYCKDLPDVDIAKRIFRSIEFP